MVASLLRVVKSFPLTKRWDGLLQGFRLVVVPTAKFLPTIHLVRVPVHAQIVFCLCQARVAESGPPTSVCLLGG